MKINSFRPIALLITGIFFGAGTLPAAGQQRVPAWEAVSGKWVSTSSTLLKLDKQSDSGLLLSTEWYRDCRLSGSIQIDRALNDRHVGEIVFRYAGRTESYSLSVDFDNSQAHLVSRHLGETRVLAERDLKGLGEHDSLSFQLHISGDDLEVVLRNDSSFKPRRVTIAHQGLKIPEGRAGFFLHNSSAHISRVSFSGSPGPRTSTYAFRCNVTLNKDVAHSPMWRYLNAVASSQSAANSRTFKSISEFEDYRREIILQLRRSIGLDPWPRRAALNARTTGELSGPGFRVEKVMFESQPGFKVNALLYLPNDLKSPAPAVLNPVGHYGDDGLFTSSEQNRCIGLARRGYVVMTYDPVSQGERRWLGNGRHDDIRKHLVLGGMEATGLMVWDSIRAIDYLVGRKEVDESRIGITGVSGGAFNALYTAILDERVSATAPACFATSIEALVKRGQAGCCAYLPGLNLYADYPQLYSLIAPRKLLVLGGYRDHLSDRILPVVDTAREIYRLFAAEANLQYFLDSEGEHVYSIPMRYSLYRWFDLWFRGIQSDASDYPESELAAPVFSKASGQLKIFPSAREGVDVGVLMEQFLKANSSSYEVPRTSVEAREIQSRVTEQLRSLAGLSVDRGQPVVFSRSRRDSGQLILLKGDQNLRIPVEVRPGRRRERGESLLVYLTLADSSAIPRNESEVLRQLVENGVTVALPVVRGAASTRTPDMDSVKLFSMSLGKHLFATRIQDVQRTIDYFLSTPEYRNSRIIVWGSGTREGLMALYLGAIDSRVDVVVSSRALMNYSQAIEEPGSIDFDYYIPGLLRYADVPQIIGAIAPRPVIVSSPVSTDNVEIEANKARQSYSWALDLYRLIGSDAFSIVTRSELQRNILKYSGPPLTNEFSGRRIGVRRLLNLPGPSQTHSANTPSSP